MLILAALHAGQNVSPASWPRRCHTMPPQGNVMGGQVWPQWKRLSCHVSHIHCRGNMHVCGCSVWTCWMSLSAACDGGLCPTAQGKTKGWDYFITWHLCDASLETWRWPRCRFPLLDPFVNISVYFSCSGVNINFFFLHKQAKSATKEATHTQDICLHPAKTVTCPHQVDLTNLCFACCRFFFLSVLCLKNNGANNNSVVKVPQVLNTATKSAAGSIWRPPLSSGWNWLAHTKTHQTLKNAHFVPLLSRPSEGWSLVRLKQQFSLNACNYSVVLLKL